MILLLIVLLPWLRNYLCPGLTFGYCIHKTKEVNVERAFDEELLLDDEKITVLKEIARYLPILDGLLWPEPKDTM